MVSVAIQLNKINNTYSTGEFVKGAVVLTSKGTSSHMGITLQVEGSVALQLSPKTVGIFEAFYNTIKPLQLINCTIPLSGPGKLNDGKTTFVFEFELKPRDRGPPLFETYHGVFVNVQYSITVDITRGMFAKNQKEVIQFNVQNPGQTETTSPVEPKLNEESISFKLEPKNLKNVRTRSLEKVPNFLITGQVDRVICDITEPFTGHVCVEHCDIRIRSIELQLVRVEYCAAVEGVAKEATEIQNIQIGDGDICQKTLIPMYMIFPRWFTCPTLVASNFKVEFEVNLVIILEDSHQLTENFPIKLYRPSKSYQQHWS